VANLDLRPLSLGEILDRTFSLYRGNFLLFAGIAAIPQLLVLCLNLVTTAVPAVSPMPAVNLRPPSAGIMALGFVPLLIGIVIYVVAYLFAQGGTVFAVSELYLGRDTTIIASLKRMRGHFWTLLGVIILNGIAVGAATLLLIIPGIWLACRLVVCVPAALLEDLGPSESLSRSFRITEDYAGRSFLIYLLYFVLNYAATLLLMFPFTFAAGLSARNPEMARLWLVMSHFGQFVATVVVTPILTIATSVFYYDLRIRQEAFDLQVMLNSLGGGRPGAAPATPSQVG